VVQQEETEHVQAAPRSRIAVHQKRTLATQRIVKNNKEVWRGKMTIACVSRSSDHGREECWGQIFGSTRRSN
jgi:hypothetical protein